MRICEHENLNYDIGNDISISVYEQFEMESIIDEANYSSFKTIDHFHFATNVINGEIYEEYLMAEEDTM